MATIDAVQVVVTAKVRTTRKIRAVDGNGKEWENHGNANKGFLKEVFDKILAGTPTIKLTVQGDFLVQSDDS